MGQWDNDKNKSEQNNKMPEKTTDYMEHKKKSGVSDSYYNGTTYSSGSSSNDNNGMNISSSFKKKKQQTEVVSGYQSYTPGLSGNKKENKPSEDGISSSDSKKSSNSHIKTENTQPGSGTVFGSANKTDGNVNSAYSGIGTGNASAAAKSTHIRTEESHADGEGSHIRTGDAGSYQVNERVRVSRDGYYDTSKVRVIGQNESGSHFDASRVHVSTEGTRVDKSRVHISTENGVQNPKAIKGVKQPQNAVSYDSDGNVITTPEAVRQTVRVKNTENPSIDLHGSGNVETGSPHLKVKGEQSNALNIKRLDSNSAVARARKADPNSPFSKDEKTDPNSPFSKDEKTDLNSPLTKDGKINPKAAPDKSKINTGEITGKEKLIQESKELKAAKDAKSKKIISKNIQNNKKPDVSSIVENKKNKSLITSTKKDNIIVNKRLKNLKTKTAGDKIADKKIGWQSENNKIKIKKKISGKEASYKIRRTTAQKIKINTRTSKARYVSKESPHLKVIQKTKIIDKSKEAISTKPPKINYIPNQQSNIFENLFENITTAVQSQAQAVVTKSKGILSILILFVMTFTGIATSYNIVMDDRYNIAMAGFTPYDSEDKNSKNLTTVAAEDIEKRRQGYKRKILYGDAGSTSSYAPTGSGNAVFDGSQIYPGNTYNLTDAQLTLISDMCCSENFNLQGTAAEATLMCNAYEYYTRSRPQSRTPDEFFSVIYDDYDTLVPGGRWFATSRGEAELKATPEHIDVVNRVIRQGQRVMPVYVTEHDCISDITSSSTGGEWIPNVTVLSNCYGSTYTFFCRPPDSDPFGYIQSVYDYYQAHPEAGNVTVGPVSGGSGGITQKSNADTEPTKGIKTVKCYSATMDGSPIFLHGNYGNGVVNEKTSYVYTANATYYHTEERQGENEDGEEVTVKETTTTTSTEYITETIGVRDTSFTFKYTDKDGNDFYYKEDDPMLIENEGVSYDENRYIQAIIGCTTIRTGNQEVDPDKYLDYIYDMVDVSIKAGRGFSVDYETYETGGTMTWELDGGFASAPEVALRANVTLDLNCNLDELMQADHMKIWDSEAQSTLYDYYIMDWEYFCMYHNIDINAGNAGGLTGVAREVYMYLSKKGMDDIHIAAILGNMMQESTLIVDAVQGSRWTGADFERIHYDGTSKGVNSEFKDTKRGYGLIQWTGGRTNGLQAFADSEGGSWKEVDVQMGFFMEEYMSNSTGSPWLHGAKSREAFEATDDLDEATKIFFDDFEQPGDDTLPIRQRYAHEFYNKIKATGADVETYMQWVEQIANDNSHGYSQDNRLGNPDYDCSSLVYAALTQAGGFTINVPWGDFWTGIEIESLVAIGFTKMPFNMNTVQRGDVLWRHGHTEFYYGDGKTIGAHTDKDGMSGDSTATGYEISAVDISGSWEIILRPPAMSGSGGGEDANLSIEADVKFDTYNTIAGIKVCIPGHSRSNGEAQAFAVDVIFGFQDTIDGCYIYKEGIWGDAAEPGQVGKAYDWINEHSEVLLNNWFNIKACWWEDGTVRGYINGKQYYEDKADMIADGAQIEGTAMQSGDRIHAEFKNVKVYYKGSDGKYGTAGQWRNYGWYGLYSTITNTGSVKSGSGGYCTNGEATYEMSAVMDGVASGCGGLNWDTTMKYGNGCPLSTIVQISANR